VSQAEENSSAATGLARLERGLLHAWRTLPHNPAADRLGTGLSRFGDHAHGWVALGLVGAVCDRRRAPRWLAAAVTEIATEQASRRIKQIVRRSRPELDGLPPLAPVTALYSFPSSHAATAAAAVYAFEGLLPRPLLAGWALLTAASRPYLGVHYPSDVGFGVLLGCVVGRVATGLTRPLLPE